MANKDNKVKVNKHRGLLTGFWASATIFTVGAAGILSIFGLGIVSSGILGIASIAVSGAMLISSVLFGTFYRRAKYRDSKLVATEQSETAVSAEEVKEESKQKVKTEDLTVDKKAQKIAAKQQQKDEKRQKAEVKKQQKIDNANNYFDYIINNSLSPSPAMFAAADVGKPKSSVKPNTVTVYDKSGEKKLDKDGKPVEFEINEKYLNKIQEYIADNDSGDCKIEIVDASCNKTKYDVDGKNYKQDLIPVLRKIKQVVQENAKNKTKTFDEEVEPLK